MKHHEPLARRERKSSGGGLWSIIGSLALLGVAAVVIASIPDIKRYIKISSM